MKRNLFLTLLSIVMAVTGYLIRLYTEPISKNGIIVATVKKIIPGDSVPYEITRYIPKPVYTDTGSRILIPAEVDTGFIIASYYAKKFYGDTLRNDSSMFVAVYDSVYNNSIIYRRSLMLNRRATAIITNNYYIPSESYLSAGIDLLIGSNRELLLNLGYTKKNGYMFRGSISTKGSVLVGFSLPVKRWKEKRLPP